MCLRPPLWIASIKAFCAFCAKETPDLSTIALSENVIWRLLGSMTCKIECTRDPAVCSSHNPSHACSHTRQDAGQFLSISACSDSVKPISVARLQSYIDHLAQLPFQLAPWTTPPVLASLKLSSSTQTPHRKLSRPAMM